MSSKMLMKTAEIFNLSMIAPGQDTGISTGNATV
jgi:hypothetical protein